MNPLKISLKTGQFQNNPRQFDVHYVKETPREVGVHLTSREAGSVGGQMVKKMNTIRSVKYERNSRVAAGHKVEVKYIVGLIV